MPASRRPAAFLLVAAAACRADLPVPEPPNAPVLTGLRPDHGFAGDVIELHGTAFVSEPAANEVLFEGGRGSGFTHEGALLVAVPDDVGSGHIAVQTAHGASAPVGPFTYDGLGRPRSGSAGLDIRVLYRPVGLAVVDGEVFIASGLLDGVLSDRERRLDCPARIAAGERDHLRGLAAAPDGSWLVAALDGSLRIFSPADGTTRRLVPAPGFGPGYLVAVAEGGRYELRVAGDFDEGGLGYAQFDPAAPPEALAPRRLPYLFSAGIAASEDGAWTGIVTAENDAAGSRYGALLIAPDGAQHWVALEEGVVQAIAIAGGRVWLGLYDGQVAVIDLASSPPALQPERLSTRGNTPVGTLRAARLGGRDVLIATKPSQRRVLAMDAAGSVLWNVEAGLRPLHAEVSSDTRRVWVADDQSNVVDVLDLETGYRRDQIDFDPGLGNPSGTEAGIILDRVAGERDRLLVTDRRARGLVVIDVETLEPLSELPLSPGTPPRVVRRGPDGRLWVLRDRALSRLDDDGTEQQLCVLPGEARRLALAGTADRPVAVAGMREGIGAWTGGGSLAVPQTWPGSFLELLEIEDGDVLVVWSNYAGGEYAVKAARWPLAGLLAGAPPARQTSGAELGASGFVGAAMMRDGLTLFFGDRDRAGPVAVHLDSSLRVAKVRRSPVALPQPFSVSPDGRHVFWTDYARDDGIVHFAGIDARSGDIVDEATRVLPGTVQGSAYSATGERAFIPVGGAGVIAVVE